MQNRPAHSSGCLKSWGILRLACYLGLNWPRAVSHAALARRIHAIERCLPPQRLHFWHFIPRRPLGANASSGQWKGLRRIGGLRWFDNCVWGTWHGWIQLPWANIEGRGQEPHEKEWEQTCTGGNQKGMAAWWWHGCQAGWWDPQLLSWTLR